VAEQVIRVCDIPDEHPHDDASEWVLTPPGGKPILIDLCPRHALPLQDVVIHGRPATAANQRARQKRRTGFQKTSLEDIR
jgi:hypothetical protein